MAQYTESGADMIQNGIFEDLQRKIDEEAAVKDALRDLVQTLEKQDRSIRSILLRAHSTAGDPSALLEAAEEHIRDQKKTIKDLARLASQHPYYKFNYAWTRQMQDACFTLLFCGWLRTTQLLTIEDVGSIMDVPVNLKDRDEFHLTIEEYLLALISLIDELARLARNSVTLGDYNRPLQISQFIKDIHAGFQILNLKNDTLRKRSDGIKYRVKEVEDVVYDLSLRGLLPRSTSS